MCTSQKCKNVTECTEICVQRVSLINKSLIHTSFSDVIVCFNDATSAFRLSN